MARKKEEDHTFSRRTFLQQMRWAPVLFLPAPFYASPFRELIARTSGNDAPAFDFADFRITPHYPAKSPLDDVLRKVAPGSDEYVTEKYAFEIMRLLDEWSRALKVQPPALDVLAKFLDASLEGSSLAPSQQNTLRSAYGIEIIRRKFASNAILGRERFLEEIKTYLASMPRVETAEFEIAGIEEIAGSPLRVRVDIRYDLVGTGTDTRREERIGQWLTQWSHDEANGWRVLRWQATEETVSRAREPIFIDVTSQALGQTESYKKQMLHGVDYWRTVLDGACGIDVYGNNGLAVGDFDNDGLDDLYVCQPAGLPNRLYRNRGDGTFEDVTEKAGVGVLDGTACALFADFENKGLQDLLVVCGSGPLLFLNQGNGKFSLKRDAFQFAQPPQGTFTHAAVADYDRDGRLDIYFCLYSYYLGLDQYHYPAPYFDARNGPPNFLLHNEGNATFQDRTEAAGLNVDNDRYSFACAWGDYNSDGAPDLYVANDFGRNNLYRNDGDGNIHGGLRGSGRRGRRRGDERMLVRFRQRRQAGHVRREHVVSRGHASFRTKNISRKRSGERSRALSPTRARQFAVSKSREREVSKRESGGGSGDGALGVVLGRLGLRPRRLPGPVHRERLYFRAAPEHFRPRRGRPFEFLLAAGRGEFARKCDAVAELRAGVERHQRADPVGRVLERLRAKRFLREQSRRNVFRCVGHRWIGFSRRQPLVCACRPGPRRATGSDPQKPKRAATPDLAQRDEGHWQLDRISLARNKKQSRCDRRRGDRRSGKDIARRSICRPAPDFSRSTPRNFSLALENPKAPSAPRFAGPAD